MWFDVYAEGGSKKRKGGKAAKKNQRGPVIIDHNKLASNYYGTIVAGLSLIRDLPQALGLYLLLAGRYIFNFICLSVTTNKHRNVPLMNQA